MRNLKNSLARRYLFYILFIAFCMLIPAQAFAVQQFETRYFTIIYDENGEYTAGEIAKFCDEIYEQLMAQYDSFSDDPRVVCVVNDAIDLANGFAIYFENSITIYATNMDFELRGQTNWLKNVFVHEMTHMIALKKAAKGPVNFISLGAGRYNDNPDFDVDIALYHLAHPAWFSEGTAQVGAETFGSERWDTHRDMILRSAWMEDKLLSLDNMAVLPGKTGDGAEMVYNQGYSLVKYIKDTYGYNKVTELNNKSGYFNFKPAVKKALGIDAGKLYDDWLASLDSRYASFKGRTISQGQLIEDIGTADYYPAVSPDGRYLAWLSNREKDYALTDLMLKDLTTGETNVIVKYVDYRIAWSHDSTKLLYVRRPERQPQFYDIYYYDVTEQKERRITKNMRARDPYFSPGDSLIVFVRNVGGNNTLGIINTEGTGLRFLTTSHDGTQFYTPSFSPDGSKILFSVYRQNLDRDIALIDANATTYRYTWDYADSTLGYADSTLFGSDSGFELLVSSQSDERDPVFLPDGSGIVYVSDRTGVFNLFRLSFDTDRAVRMTELYGGAFAPSAGNDASIYYAGYTSGNFSIFRIDSGQKIEETENTVMSRDYMHQPEAFDLSEQFDIEAYQRKRVVNAILPTVRVGPSFIGSKFGLNVLDAGARVYISDPLGYDALILGGSVGKNLKEEVGLNSMIEFYYERSMRPVTSSKYTHSPRFYFGASRTVINNLIKGERAKADSAYFDDMPDLGYENVYHDIHRTGEIDYQYNDEFRLYRLGLFVPLARRHSLSFEAGYRQYLESLNISQKIKDYSNFFLDGVDITHEVPGAGKTSTQEVRYFNDMNYFTSGDFTVSYVYSKSVPAADNIISPQGTAVMLQFRHMRAAVSDSLVDQPSYYAPLGINMDGSIAVGEYNPDPMLDFKRTFNKNTDINEYLAIVQYYRRLPFRRHTLNTAVITAYRDIALKDWRKEEGSGYNWPLKYYLGGANLLSGYPYFAFWGSKLFYSRIGYTFPIREFGSKGLLGINFLRCYGNVFFEAGKVWNFDRISINRIMEGSFKRDVGFEMRFTMTAFYRLPMLAYAKIAWPLDGMGDSPYENDARRFYFGLRM